MVAPPLRGADFAISNGCCGIGAHTRSLQTIDGKRYLAQRFATDWLQLDGQGRWWTGDPAVNESYPVFGARVFAATSGVVVSTRNDLPENTPPHALANIDLSNAPGNHVTVDIGGSRFATYAHMQPGSVTVRVGDRIHRGRVLGRVGNTGRSSAPPPAEAWLGQEVSVPADIGPVAPPARRRGQLPLTAGIVTFRRDPSGRAIGGPALGRARDAMVAIGWRSAHAR